MRTTFKFLLPVLLFVLAGLGCSKTEEGETKRQATLIKKFETMKSEFPKLADDLVEVQKKSQAAFDEAKKVSDAEARIEAMANANGIMSKVTSKFSSFKEAVKKAESSVSKAKKHEARPEVKAAIDKLKSEIKDSKKDIYEDDPGSLTEWLKEIDEEILDLKVKREKLDKMVKGLDKAAKAAKSAKPTDKTAKPADKTATPTKAPAPAPTKAPAPAPAKAPVPAPAKAPVPTK